MENKKNTVFLSQGYIAPRAESVAIAQENILCASAIDGITTSDYTDGGTVQWGGSNGDGGGN